MKWKTLNPKALNRLHSVSIDEPSYQPLHLRRNELIIPSTWRNRSNGKKKRQYTGLSKKRVTRVYTMESVSVGEQIRKIAKKKKEYNYMAERERERETVCLLWATQLLFFYFFLKVLSTRKHVFIRSRHRVCFFPWKIRRERTHRFFRVESPHVAHISREPQYRGGVAHDGPWQEVFGGSCAI